ncbi:MAG: hypothetical protein NVS1B11_36000 [Terriglobales bacterium]
MSEEQRKHWRELCSAAIEAKNSEELQKIVQELNRALQREEQSRRDFRGAGGARNSREDI